MPCLWSTRPRVLLSTVENLDLHQLHQRSDRPLPAPRQQADYSKTSHSTLPRPFAFSRPPPPRSHSPSPTDHRIGCMADSAPHSHPPHTHTAGAMAQIGGGCGDMNASQRVCRLCGIRRGASSYSRKQWRRSHVESICSLCTEKGEWPPVAQPDGTFSGSSPAAGGARI